MTSSIERDLGTGGDIYLGRPEAMVEEGLLTAAQIPGWPGMPPTSATFYDGKQVARHQRVPHDERWMQVTRIGNNVRLTKGITAEEKGRRIEIREIEMEELARNSPKKDPGRDKMSEITASYSSQLKVGDEVMAFGESGTVTGSFCLRHVRCDDGEFADQDGGRFDYRHGYSVRLHDGKEYFYPAHALIVRGAQSHLRVACGARPKIARPLLAFRERERQ